MNTILDYAKKQGTLGFTVDEVSKEFNIPSLSVEEEFDSMRKHAKIIRTIDKRNGQSIHIHLNEMANYMFARAAKRIEQEGVDTSRSDSLIGMIERGEITNE